MIEIILTREKESQTPIEGNVFNYIPNFYYFMKDTRGNFINVNIPFANLLNCKSPDEVIGKNDNVFFPNYLVQKYKKDDMQIVKTGKGIFNVMEMIFHDDGETDWFNTTKLPILSEKKEVVALECFTRYIKKADTPMSSDVELKMALKHITNHFSEKISLDKLAKMSAMSVRQFERRFKAAYNVSAKQYIVKIRLEAASHFLVKTDLNVSEIAYRIGFYDNSHFFHSFKNQYKFAPQEYRNKYKMA